MIVGFTGTSGEITEEQQNAFLRLVKELDITEFHHGDCIGADEFAAALVMLRGIRTLGHPPKNPYKRAYVQSDYTFPEKDYLERNHDIVDACELLIAMPKETHEQVRSGTWATVRYARKLRQQIIYIFPNGTTTKL